MKRISSKIFLSHIIVIFILASLVLYFSYTSIKQHYFDIMNEELHSLNKSLQFPVKQLMINSTSDSLDKVIKYIGNDIKTRITVIDTDGKVLADSDFNPELMDNHSNRNEVQEAMNIKVGQSIRYSVTTKEEMIYLATPIMYNSKLIGVLRISKYNKNVFKLLHNLRSEMIYISIWVIFITLFGVLIYTRKLTRPINQLSIAVANIASGDFDYRVRSTGNDEIAILAQNFNLMTKKIKELFVKVDSQREELNTLIGSINEGFVVLNSSGRILLSNSTFNDLIETEDIEGMKIKKVIKDKVINKMFKETQKNQKSITKEIIIKSKHILAITNYIETKEEIVIIFHDITELKQFQQVKKDFVVNVSHELRTPLTAIKGFVETLEEEIDSSIGLHYLNIIARHTNRLIILVQDLLTLSELEDSQNQLYVSEFNLYKFIVNVVKIFEQKLTDKNLTLEIVNNVENEKIQADKFRIEQLFINLIDNSIKYTDKGKITIVINKQLDFFEIEVHDSGIGISEEHLDRIFERFYLVNKSRTRKEGGTGLGLSIVKHIVLLHQGQINVTSKLKEGTIFFVKLPILQPNLPKDSEEAFEEKLENELD